MKRIAGFLIACLGLAGLPGASNAQDDVVLAVPAHHIFNRTEFNTIAKVFNTNGNTKWRKALLGLLLQVESPTMRSMAGNTFVHQGLPGTSLPNSVLQWRLFTIGGTTEFGGGSIPGFRSFTTSAQTWYNLSLLNLTLLGNDYTAGDVTFNFKIPAANFGSQSYHAGEYTMPITHNYGTPGGLLSSNVVFIPATFDMILAIPAAISWLSAPTSRFIEINALEDYRTASNFLLGDPWTVEAGHTVEFDLWAKAFSQNIQFTSSKNVQGSRDVSVIRLGSTDPHLVTAPLSATWQNFSNTSSQVTTGNRTQLPLQLSITGNDLRNYFYQAGTYSFQLNLEARSADQTVNTAHSTNITVQVQPLSEITIPVQGQPVHFEFNTSAHYTQGQSRTVPDQIRLSNNEYYELYVKSGTGHFSKSGVASDIESEILQIGVSGQPLKVALSTAPRKIISNGTPVLDEELDVIYTILPEHSAGLVAREKATYSIDVIYSFTAL